MEAGETKIDLVCVVKNLAEGKLERRRRNSISIIAAIVCATLSKPLSILVKFAKREYVQKPITPSNKLR